jgi:hypothetical protein
MMEKKHSSLLRYRIYEEKCFITLFRLQATTNPLKSSSVSSLAPTPTPTPHTRPRPAPSHVHPRHTHICQFNLYVGISKVVYYILSYNSIKNRLM